MRKAGEVGVVDRDAIHRLGQVAEPGAEDQADRDRRGAGAGADDFETASHAQRSLT